VKRRKKKKKKKNEECMRVSLVIMFICLMILCIYTPRLHELILLWGGVRKESNYFFLQATSKNKLLIIVEKVGA